MMCFLNRTNDVGWSDTPLYQAYKRDFAVGKSAKIQHKILTIYRKSSRDAKPGAKAASRTSNPKEYLAHQERRQHQYRKQRQHLGKHKQEKAGRVVQRQTIRQRRTIIGGKLLRCLSLCKKPSTSA